MKYRALAIAIGVLLAASAAQADPLNVVAGTDTVWHSFQTPSTAQVKNSGWGPAMNIVPGTAFWNNWSIDGSPNHQCNIGYWLSGTGGCSAPNSTSPQNGFLADSPNMTSNYLGNGTTGFNFTRSSDTASVQMTMRVQVPASNWLNYLGKDEFGWFDMSDPSTLNPLFGGTETFPIQTARGTVATFIPSSSYGFYLRTPNGTYLSTGVGDSQSHFAVFQLQGTDHYMFGLEDLNNAGLSDWDYNDMVVEMSINLAPVPEPATMLLFGLGLIGLARVRMKRS